MKILIKDATLIDKNSSFHQHKKSIFIKDGQIEKIADHLEIEDAQVIHGKALVVSPTFFDPFVNFGEPGFEDRETIINGLAVAAKGGFGDVILQSSTHPNFDQASTVDQILSKYTHEICRLHISGTLSMAKAGKELSEILELDKYGVKGFSDVLNSIEDANLLKLALLYAQKADQTISSFPLDRQLADHAAVHENIDTYTLGLRSMPAMAEEIRLQRDLAILAYTGGKLHIPAISTKRSVEIIKKAKEEGLNVTCGVAAHNLCYTTQKLSEFNTNFKVYPVLRSEEDRRAVISGLQYGVIDMVSSMHYPRTPEEKDCEFEQAEFGSLGLESCLGMLLKLFKPADAIDFLTRGKAIFKIDQSPIAENQPAAITCFDTEEKYQPQVENLMSSVKNSMYIGENLPATIRATIKSNQSTIYG